MDYSVMKIIMSLHFPWGYKYFKFLAIAGDNDDAWVGARQLSGQREPAPGARSQSSQGWDKILPGSGTNRYGSSGSDTLTDSAPATPDPLPRYISLRLSQLGSSSTSLRLRRCQPLAPVALVQHNRSHYSLYSRSPLSSEPAPQHSWLCW